MLFSCAYVLVSPTKYATANTINDFTGVLAHHSRTSSSASSAGSSYVSSTDSNKDSPHKTSPAHSRQSSHSSTSMRQSLAAENDRNIINANYNNASVHHVASLPHYQQHLRNGDCYSADDDCYEDDCDDVLSVTSSSASPFSISGGVGIDQCDKLSMNSGQFEQQPPSTTDITSLYDTLKQQQHIHQNQNNKNPIMHDSTTSQNNGKELNYRTLNGDLIRSVQPPGKGKALPYKVSSCWNDCKLPVK